MSAHTPGPWGWDSRNSNYYLLTFASDAPHQIVAELKTPRDAMGDADAHLIAAAPELLEYALMEEAVEEFDCPHDADARCDCGPRQDAMFRRARELRKRAIAKAEGK